MGNIIPTNIEELTEGHLKHLLNMEIYDYGKIESGGEGYTYLYCGNIEDSHSEILVDLGFNKIKEDLWIMEGFEISPEKALEVLLPAYEKSQTKLWKDIINQRCKIDEYFRGRQREPLFRTTSTTLQISMKWQGKLCMEESIFNAFIVDLHKVVLEGINGLFLDKVKGISRELEVDFYRGLKDVRNMVAHDSDKYEQVKRAQLYLKEVSNLDYPPPPNENWYYTEYQFKILENCLDFLKKIDAVKGEMLER